MKFQHALMPPPAASGAGPVYFLDWLTSVLTPAAEARSEKVFEHLLRVAAPLGRLKTTPQTPPFHAEGDFVVDHVKRMLAGLGAFESGATLAQIEELVREKDFVLELQALEQMLKTQTAFLSAYAVCHDLAKSDALAFSALPGSRGEAEGFTPHSLMATEPMKIRYDKLRRAHAATGATPSFYDAYGIAVHYPHHASHSASDEYASTRAAVLEALAIPAAMSKLLTELIRCHLGVIQTFSQGSDPVKYRALAAISERAGINSTVFLDFLPAIIFTDAVLGSLVYVNRVPRVELQTLLNVFKSEREAMPERHSAREEAVRRGKKTALREALKEAQIDADTVFDLLKTPYGPVRGEVMAKVHDLIRDPERKANFGELTNELRRRARLAQKFLHDQQLTLD